jgi:hypothetical protein
MTDILSCPSQLYVKPRPLQFSVLRTLVAVAVYLEAETDPQLPGHPSLLVCVLLEFMAALTER